MKKVIRLTESDLMRIVKRVINEQQSGQTDISPDVKKHLNTDEPVSADLVLVPFDVDKEPTNPDLVADEGYRNSSMEKLLEEYKHAAHAINKLNELKPMNYETQITKWKTVKQDKLTSIMTQMTSGNIRLQPSNGGIEIKPYGAKYIPHKTDSFKIVSCTQQKPCRNTDPL